MSGTWGPFVLFFLAMMFILLERRNEAPGTCNQGRRAAWLFACAGSADIAILLLENQLTG
jgi:hypothetical protein